MAAHSATSGTQTVLVDGQQIARDNIIHAITDAFDSGAILVTVDSADGGGKTTLLSQFAQKYQENTLTIFCTAASGWTYDPQLVRDNLFMQIQRITKKGAPPNDDQIAEEADYRLQLLALQKRAQKGRSYYFVVDGLHAIPASDTRHREAILRLLPIGIPGFRFLVTLDLSELPQGARRVKNKSITIPGFSLAETYEYLDTSPDESAFVQEICRTTKGNPATLASVRRLLESGLSLKALTEDLPGNLPGLFSMEWRRVDEHNTLQSTLLALLAIDGSAQTLEHLARVARSSPDIARDALNHLTFIVYDARGDTVQFVSDSFRKFAITRLAPARKRALDLLIEHLSADPQSESSLSLLPNYLSRAERHKDLLEYLSPERFAQCVESSKSIAPIYQKADLAIRAAATLKRDGDIFRFSLHKSTVQHVGVVSLWRSQIEALLALGDYPAALNVANSANLPEDRLHSLVVLARHQKRQGHAVDQAILDQINTLGREINPAVLGRRVIKIASDLVYLNPKLAFELADHATKSVHDDREREWAWAYLSVSAVDASARETPEHRGESSGMFNSIMAKLKDPSTKQFSLELASLLGDFSARQVLIEAEGIPATEDKLRLLAHWTDENRERDDALEVVAFGLDTAVRATEYQPSANVLERLALPLPFAKNQTSTALLIKQFDSLREAAEKAENPQDFVRFQLALAHGEGVFGIASAQTRLVDTYSRILAMTDVGIRAACAAEFVALLLQIDPQKTLEQGHDLHSTARELLDKSIDELLCSTADQLIILRPCIVALCHVDATEATSLASRLNTLDRREHALLDVVTELVSSPFDVETVVQVIELISEPRVRDLALLRVILGALSLASVPSPTPATWYPVFDRISQMQDADSRCSAYCAAHTIIRKCSFPRSASYETRILSQLTESWAAIDPGWRRIDIGYRITAALAEHASESAREFLNSMGSACGDIRITTQSAANAYLYCARLAVRAYGGLLARTQEQNEEAFALQGIIDRIPSYGERAFLWSSVALKFHTVGRIADCQKIVVERIRPLLSQFPVSDTKRRNEAIVRTAPALYCAHVGTTLDDLAGLPVAERDRAIVGITMYLLRRVHPADPFENVRGQWQGTTYNELHDLLKLFCLVSEDQALFVLVRTVCEMLSSNAAARELTREQVSFIVIPLKGLVEQQFPKPNHISHEGYRVASLAYVERLQNSKKAAWSDLLNRARAIPNLSDRAFVTTIVAACMPPSEASTRKAALDEAETAVALLPTNWERISRYTHIAQTVFEFDPDRARRCLRMATASTLESDRAEFFSLQRRMIDLAYRIEPRFAENLASEVGDDPARVKARANLREGVELLKLKEAIADKGREQDSNRASDQKFAQAAWSALGALNAGRLRFLDLQAMRQAAERASNAPLHLAYPIMALVIESAVRRFERTDQSGTILREIFRGAERASLVAGTLVERSTPSNRGGPMVSARTETRSGGTIIRAGERALALQWLTKWFEDRVRGYLKICDPYFGPEDLRLLQLVRQSVRSCQVQILTSKKHQDDQHVTAPYDEFYLRYWRANISDQPPPPTDIVVVALPVTGALPIHDRWWITEGSGIRVGTSFGSLGGKRDSEIGILTEDEIDDRERDIDQYLNRTKREHEGSRISYYLFTL